MHIPTKLALPMFVLLGILAVAILVMTGPAGATDVSQDITSPTRWTTLESPYVIIADITVTNGVTLTIDPGVEVLFDGFYHLATEGSGKVVASGVATTPIKIGSNSVVPIMGDWNYFDVGNGGVLKNATIEYGTLLVIAGATSIVSDCHFQHATTGLLVEGSGTKVVGCTFWGMGSVGMAVEDANAVQVLRCSTNNVPQGFNMLGSTSDTLFKGCIANNSANHGFGYSSVGGNNRIKDCRITKSSRGVYITGISSASGDLWIYNSTMEKCTFAGVFMDSSTPPQTLKVQRCRMYEGGTGFQTLSAGNFEVLECTFRDNDKGTLVETTTGYTGYIHKNCFKGNNLDAATIDSEVYYDKDGRGNFWYRAIFEYNFRDSNGDGIADTPWVLTGTQKDNYPLMKPVDYEDPVADAGPDKKEKQGLTFKLDGSRSSDDNWIWNWTWLIDLPGSEDPVYYDVDPSVVIDIAGVFLVTLQCRDYVGNSDSDTMLLNITDRENPRFVNVTTPPDVGAGEVLTISAIVSDNVGVASVSAMYSFGIGGVKNELKLSDLGDGLWSGDLAIPLDATQKVYYYLNAKDALGNNARTIERTVNIRDVTPPEMEPAMGSNVTTGDKAWINATVIDNRLVAGASVEYWFGDGEHTTVNQSRMGFLWVVEIGVPRDAPSPLRIIFRSQDEAGNLNESDVFEVPVRDNDPPVLNLDNTSPLIYQGEKTLFSAVISDNIDIRNAYVELKYSGETEYTKEPLTKKESTWNATITIATFKIRLFYHYRVIDTSGNVLVTEDEDILLLSQRPSIVTSPELDAYEGMEYRQDFEAEDPDNEAYEFEWIMETNAAWLDWDPVEGTIWGTPEARDIGVYTVTITVLDPDRSSDSLTFTLVVNDVNTPPEVSIVFPEDGQKVGNVLRVSGRASDDLGIIDWVRVRIDDGEWHEASGTTTWEYEAVIKGLTPGEHYIDAKASDGQKESKTATVVIIVPKKDSEEDGGVMAGSLGTIAIVVVVALAIGLLLAYLFVVRRE